MGLSGDKKKRVFLAIFRRPGLIVKPFFADIYIVEFHFYSKERPDGISR